MQHQGRGIAKKLMNRAMAMGNRKDISFFDVNSSPYAVEIYKKMGFVPTDDEQLVNGIRFIPMKKELGD